MRSSVFRQAWLLVLATTASLVSWSSVSAANCAPSQNGMSSVLFGQSWTVGQVRQCNDANGQFVQSFGQFSDSDLYFPNGRVYSTSSNSWFSASGEGWKDTSAGPACTVNGNGGFTVGQVRDPRCSNPSSITSLFAQFSDDDYFFTDVSVITTSGKKYGLTAQKEWKEIGSNCAYDMGSKKVVCGASGVAPAPATSTTTTATPSANDCNVSQNGMSSVLFGSSWTIGQVRQCNDASSSFVRGFAQFSSSDLYFANGRVYSPSSRTWYYNSGSGWKDTSAGPACTVNGNGGFTVGQVRDPRCSNPSSITSLFAQFSDDDYFFTDVSVITTSGKKYGLTAQKEWKEIGSNCAYDMGSKKVVCGASGVAPAPTTSGAPATTSTAGTKSFSQQINEYNSVCKPAWATAVAGIGREASILQNYGYEHRQAVQGTCTAEAVQSATSSNVGGNMCWGRRVGDTYTTYTYPEYQIQLSSQEIAALNKIAPSAIDALGISAHFMHGPAMARKYHTNPSASCVGEWNLMTQAFFSPIVNNADLVERLQYYRTRQWEGRYGFSTLSMIYLVAKDAGYTVDQVIEAKRAAGFDMTIRTSNGCTVSPCSSYNQSTTTDPSQDVRDTFSADNNPAVQLTPRGYLASYRSEVSNASAPAADQSYTVALLKADPAFAFGGRGDVQISFSSVEGLPNGFPLDALYYPNRAGGPVVTYAGKTYGYDSSAKKWKDISAPAAAPTPAPPVQTQARQPAQVQTPLPAQTQATNPAPAPAVSTSGTMGPNVVRVNKYSDDAVRTALRCIMLNPLSLNGVSTVQALAETINKFAVTSAQAQRALGSGVTVAQIEAAYNQYGSKDWITPLNNAGLCRGIQ